MSCKKKTEKIKFTSLTDFIIDSKNGNLGSGSFANVTLGIAKKNNKKYAIKSVK